MRSIPDAFVLGCCGVLPILPLACSSAPQAPQKVVPIVEILAAAQPAELTAQDLAPHSTDATRWQLVDAQWRPTGKSSVVLSAAAVDGSRSGWRVDGIDGTVDGLFIASDGSLQLAGTDSVGDDARTTFDPPLLLAPPMLRSDDEFISEASMRVDSMSSNRNRDNGSARRTLRIVRGERIRTPAGEWDATVIESVFTATLDMALATHRTTLLIVPNIGPVIERWEATVKVLGVSVPRDRGTAVRIDPPAQQSALLQ